IGPRSGIKDSSNRVTERTLPGPLRDLVGAEVIGYDALGLEGDNAVRFEPDEERLAEAICAAHLWCDILRPFDARILARYTEDYYAGEAAITIHRVGKGEVIYVGTVGNKDLYYLLTSWLTARCGLGPLLKAPEGVEVAVRECKGTSYLFVLNHTDREQLVRVPYRCRDLLSERFVDDWAIIGPYDVYLLVAE
ncbi:MAG: beta-galactosidase trimerization domain-containing protein, partial [Chloroflexi bacterium]|nr:beta-galactosidase trimerization domain-containing protein [Chloroflexota bacterium]